jgi:hypothetical protein
LSAFQLGRRRIDGRGIGELTMPRAGVVSRRTRTAGHPRAGNARDPADAVAAGGAAHSVAANTTRSVAPESAARGISCGAAEPRSTAAPRSTATRSAGRTAGERSPDADGSSGRARIEFARFAQGRSSSAGREETGEAEPGSQGPRNACIPDGSVHPT